MDDLTLAETLELISTRSMRKICSRLGSNSEMILQTDFYGKANYLESHIGDLNIIESPTER